MSLSAAAWLEPVKRVGLMRTEFLLTLGKLIPYFPRTSLSRQMSFPPHGVALIFKRLTTEETASWVVSLFDNGKLENGRCS